MANTDRILIWSKFQGHCGYCGEEIKLKRMQIDHIIPKSNFVTSVHNKYKIPLFLSHLTINDIDHVDNLMPSCPVCNRWKKTFHLELFRSEIQKQIERLNSYSANYRFAKRYGLLKEINGPVIFYFEKLIKL